MPLAWVVVIVLVFAGVGVALTAVLTAPSSGSTPGATTVTDDLGRTVEVPSDPARVAVLSPSIMDSMYRLGLRSHVVAVDCYAASFGGLSEDYSADQVALWNLSSSMCVQVGPTFVPSMLVDLAPDLVLASTIVSIADVEEITSQLHVPVVMLQPPTMSGILVDVSLIGVIFGVEAAAAALNGQLSTELYAATNTTATASVFPSVLLTYSVDENGYWTFGPGTFGQSLLELTGAVGLGATAGFPYPELSPQQVLSADPTWIVYGVGFGLNESTYASGPDWSNIPAVQQGNVSGIDSNWITEPDPTMVLQGIPTLLALFHPPTP
ncbi:MAG: ABC transporter substrate-binding protein [Thermoplasmata archaeon]